MLVGNDFIRALALHEMKSQRVHKAKRPLIVVAAQQSNRMLAQIGQRGCGRGHQLGGGSKMLHHTAHLGNRRGDLHGDERVVDIFSRGLYAGVVLRRKHRTSRANDHRCADRAARAPKSHPPPIAAARAGLPPQPAGKGGHNQDCAKLPIAGASCSGRERTADQAAPGVKLPASIVSSATDASPVRAPRRSARA